MLVHSRGKPTHGDTRHLTNVALLILPIIHPELAASNLGPFQALVRHYIMPLLLAKGLFPSLPFCILELLQRVVKKHEFAFSSFCFRLHPLCFLLSLSICTNAGQLAGIAQLLLSQPIQGTFLPLLLLQLLLLPSALFFTLLLTLPLPVLEHTAQKQLRTRTHICIYVSKLFHINSTNHSEMTQPTSSIIFNLCAFSA